ncbi:MAG TPA: hypothetical protein VLC95_14120 [Anaerolineae bacterium]|nr:hypothetical protein [Anaerolineae bacterium]
MGIAPTARHISLSGKPFWDGVKDVVSRLQEPILGVVHGHTLTFVALRAASLAVSWSYPLPAGVSEPFFFGIPPLIAGHLATHPVTVTGDVRIGAQGGEVSLVSGDAAGEYALRWRFDLNQFPAPPELGRLLTPPKGMISTNYLQIADAIHVAVADLALMQSRGRIHRTQLALVFDLVGTEVHTAACEVQYGAEGQYYFDPRLVMRAIEFVGADRVELGLTALGPSRAFLSLVERKGDRVTHCALLSMGLETSRLIAPAGKG